MYCLFIYSKPVFFFVVVLFCYLKSGNTLKKKSEGELRIALEQFSKQLLDQKYTELF